MPDMLQRLEEYGRHITAVTTPTDLDEVIDRVTHAVPKDRPLGVTRLTVTTQAASRRQLPSWAIVITAAVLVLVVIGGTAWLIGGGDTVDRTPATTPPATTIPVTETTPSTIPITDALFPITLGDRSIVAPWDFFGNGNDSFPFGWEIISINDPALQDEGVALVIHPRILASLLTGAVFDDMWISGDGESWEQVTLPGVLSEDGDVTATVADIAVAGQGLVAVGWSEPRPACANSADAGCIPQGTQQGVVWTSDDGRAWTRLPDAPVFEGADIHSVASDGDSLVAVGFHHESGFRGDTMAGRSLVWTSPDGVTWTRGSDDQVFRDSTMYDVVHGPGGYLATGWIRPMRDDGTGWDESIYWLSRDGHEWARVDIPTELRETVPLALTVDEDGYSSSVITRDGTRASWMSPDGITWQLEPAARAGVAVSEALSTTRIAFHTAASDGSFEHYEIFVMNIDGSEVTRLHQSVEGDQTLSDDSAADWSPDGTKLVFSSLRDEVTRDSNYEIYIMNADGSDQQRLTDSAGVDAFPDWSPDGSRIVFEREGTNGARDIWVMNADGTGQINLTNDPDHDDVSASWSPDGTQIAFASDRDDLPGGCGEDCNLDIYVMNIDGSNPVRITDDPDIDAFPEWSPDGSRLLFHSTRAATAVTESNWDVFVMNADGTDELNLTNNPAFDAHAVWSPDGTRIAFNSNRDGNIEIYLMDPDGANLTRITNTPGLEEWWPSWSPIP